MNQKPCLLLVTLLILALTSCKEGSASNQTVNTQGIFDFPDELIMAEDKGIPDYLDAEEILCNGKGLKVAKCISKQLKKGICLGIIKDKKRVYAVEIPCESVKQVQQDTAVIL